MNLNPSSTSQLDVVNDFILHSVVFLKLNNSNFSEELSVQRLNVENNTHIKNNEK